MESLALPASFSLEELDRANDDWGCNCGPSALAAVKGISLDVALKFLPDFPNRRYTNPSMMLGALMQLGGYRWSAPKPHESKTLEYPDLGLVRLQWVGSWLNPGVPVAAHYAHTHWIACRRERGSLYIFDCNNHIVEHGWLPREVWLKCVVPELLTGERASGFYETHIAALPK